MAIKPQHQHVGVDGVCYFPYLSAWDPSCNVAELIQTMQAVFGAEPPVYAKPKCKKGAQVKTQQGRHGVVMMDPDSDNEVKLKFEDGKESGYIKVPALTVTFPLAVGDSVMWTGQDSDIARGTVGKIEKFRDDGRASARFPSGCYAFELHQLVRTGGLEPTVVFTVPAAVPSSRQIIIQAPDGRKVTVQVPENAKAGQRMQVSMPAGDAVDAMASQQSEPGEKGETGKDLFEFVVPPGGKSGQRLTVQLAGGQKVIVQLPANSSPGSKMRVTVPQKFQFGDAVVWIDSDDDVPPGAVGQVEASVTAEGRVLVKFSTGVWSFKASALKKVADDANIANAATAAQQVVIKGLTGPEADLVNGRYEFVDREVYRKVGDPGKWLFVNKDGTWRVGSTGSKDARKTGSDCWAHAAAAAGGLPPAAGAVRWKVYDGSSWVEQTVQVEITQAGNFARHDPGRPEAWCVRGAYAVHTDSRRIGEVTMNPDSDDEVKLRWVDGKTSGYIKVSALTQESEDVYRVAAQSLEAAWMIQGQQVVIAGGTGLIGKMLNGRYEFVEREVFHSVDGIPIMVEGSLHDPDKWLYVAEDGTWTVGTTAEKDAKEHTVAHTVAVAGGLPPTAGAVKWQVFDGDDFVEQILQVEVLDAVAAADADHAAATLLASALAAEAALGDVQTQAGRVVLRRIRGLPSSQLLVTANHTVTFGDTFDTVGVPTGIAPASPDMFFYEVELLELSSSEDTESEDTASEDTEGSCPQFGWADHEFEHTDRHAGGHGVGDDSHSWAIDGCRLLKWHGGSTSSFGEQWAPGDVLGFAADLVSKQLLFAHNGQWSVVFDGVEAVADLFPALTSQNRLKLRANFGDRAWTFGPPSGVVQLQTG
eukprot:SAG22_NODE_409_length_10939_cov_1.956638_6_plen_870_part_00